jgi:hypothetical protein
MPLDFFDGAVTGVVQSGAQTPPTLPHPVQPLTVMQTEPVAQSAEVEHDGTLLQKTSCAQTAVFSVVVKQ